MKPINRDDVPMGVAEEAVRLFKEMHPDRDVVFAGDLPDGPPPELLKAIEEYERARDEAFVNGLCMDCGKQQPGWTGEIPDDFKLPTGWHWFSDIRTKNPVGWICPECDALDEASDG